MATGEGLASAFGLASAHTVAMTAHRTICGGDGKL